MFENNTTRIGPTGTKKNLFKMPGRGEKLRFGKRFEIPEYLSGLGLNAYEFSAGRMAKFSNSPKYEKFKANSKKFDVAISIHAPYYISLTSEKPEIYEKSIERVANVYAWAYWMNAKRIVVHPGTYGKNKKNMDLKDIINGKKTNKGKDLIEKIVSGINRGIELSYEKYPKLKSEFKKICICPETMGKHGQLGNVSEVIKICKEIGTDKARPCIDFGHLYARNLGKLTGRKLYEKTFEKIEAELGSDVLKNLHIHYSKIIYTKKGESKHVPNSDTKWGPKVAPLFEIIKEQDLTPIIINESPELEPDAQILMNKWNKINKIN